MSVTERPPELSSNSFSNAPYWLIVGGAAEGGSSRGTRNWRNARVEVLSLETADGRMLPVFGSEDSAARFARAWPADAAVTELVGETPVGDEISAEEVGGRWRPRGTGVGELVSLLSGSAFSAAPCAGVERVVLDPPPELARSMRHGLTEARVGELVSMSRGCFLERLMGRGRPWFESKEQGESL